MNDSPTARQLRRLLALLGYDTTGDDTALAVRVSSWLDAFEKRQKDPEGANAFLWSETFTRLLTGATAFDPDARIVEAVRGADVGCAEYAKRFPPVGQCAPGEYVLATEEKVKAYDPPAYAVGVENERTRWRETAQINTPEEARTLRDELDMLRREVRERPRTESADVLERLRAIHRAYSGDVEPGPTIKIYADAVARWLNDSVIAPDTAETIVDARVLLSGVISAPPCATLSELAAGVLELIAGRNRAADTLAERSEAKMRAERDSALQEKATAEERLAQVERSNKDLIERVEALTRRPSAPAAAAVYHLRACVKWVDDRFEALPTCFREAKAWLDGSPMQGALIPLPKPTKIEPGQQWARTFVVTSTALDGSAGRVCTTAGNKYFSITADRLRTQSGWVYLGPISDRSAVAQFSDADSGNGDVL